MISDFSVFHGVRDVWSMPSASFAVLAERLPYYSGAVRGALTAAAGAEEDGSGPQDGPYAPQGPQPGPDAGESFESRMARAQPILANAAGEAQISRLMAAGV